MPASFTTEEVFPGNSSPEALQEQIRLRIKAGAIRSSVQKVGDNWILTTEWNVIGEQ